MSGEASQTFSSDDEESQRCLARLGTTIGGRWRIDALLGVGGMAGVYAATETSGRRVAVKVLHPHIAISKELRARFEQEAEAVGRLNHPATVPVFDVGVTDDASPFMAMELLDGESLGQRVARQKQRMPDREVLSIADAVLDVLSAAHAAGIIHRDVKPDNIFVTSTGAVRVLDFGIARMRQSNSSVRTRTGALLGTTPYMAPEQIHGKDVDGRADIFAVGATMHLLLTGRKLHEAETDAALLIKMATTPAQSVSFVATSLDPRVVRIVDKAVSFDAAQRYPDAASMRRDIQAVLAAPIPAPAPAKTHASVAADDWARNADPTRVDPPPRRNLFIAIIATALALGVAGTVAYVALSGDKSAQHPKDDDSDDSPPKRRTSATTTATARPSASVTASSRAKTPEEELRDRVNALDSATP